jgi:hypothetical protein
MTARSLATVTSLTKDGGASVTWNTPHTTGDYVAAGTLQTTNLAKCKLLIQWGTTAGTLTVRAVGNGNNVAGSAQTSPYPSSAVFAQGAVGDLTYSWGTTAGTAVVGPFTTDRYEQPDGNLYLDWASVAGPVTYAVIMDPYNTL